MSENKRVIFTQAIGHPRYGEMALGLARSLALIGDLTPRAIITDIQGVDWKRYYDYVIPPTKPIEYAYCTKLDGLDVTDAEQVVFIDADSLVFKRMDRVFEECEGKGFVVQGHWTTEGFWYRDVPTMLKEHSIEKIGRINSGFVYYERTPECLDFIEKVRELIPQYDALGLKRKSKLYPDEPLIGITMAKEQFGYLAPEESDYMNSGIGLIGKLRCNVLTNECNYVCRRHAVRYVEPYIFHAHFYSKFLVYWKQLRILEALEKYEDTHEFGYMSQGQKLRRSIERRILKWLLKKI